jgi:hypothetical protein
MKYVAEVNKLELGKDVKLQSIGNSSAYNTFIQNNLNKTQYGILFCVDRLSYFNQSLPCSLEYSDSKLHMYNILYNVTNSPNGFLTAAYFPYPKDPVLIKLKTDIDNGYMNYYANLKNIEAPKINLYYSDFPSVNNRFMQGADMVSSSGAFYFFFPPVITFVVVLMEIVREKDLKLRKSLLIIGLNNTAFWVSWLITSIVYAVLVSIILVVSGKICQFDFFNNTPFLITFFLFFLYNLSMQFLAYFMTAILRSTKSAYTVK